MTVRVEHGDCRDVLVRLKAEGVLVDSVVTDTPYGLASIVARFGGPEAAEAKDRDGAFARASRGFMGQTWDNDIAFKVEVWRAVFDVMKPGAWLLAFSGTRTYHRMADAIEAAGFEVRDRIRFDHDSEDDARRLFASLNAEQAGQLCKILERYPGMMDWTYGTGFPKSHDTERAVARALCTLPGRHYERDLPPADRRQDGDHVCCATAESEAWEGWGTALKPAAEPICVARKPLIGSVAANVLEHGTGALNVMGCAIPAEKAVGWGGGAGGGNRWNAENCGLTKSGEARPADARFPANVVHDGSAEVIAAYPNSAGQRGAVKGTEPSRPAKNVYNPTFGRSAAAVPRGDPGSVARFFYSAKADAFDRFGTKHPTVKPIDLMQWLCRLVTPPRGTVLDLFAGSGTTGAACIREGFDAILIEQQAEYVADIKARLEAVSDGGRHSLAIKHRHVAEETRAGADLPLFGLASDRGAAE